MSDFPDFSSHGYQIIRELGSNSIGGRVTYQAVNIKNQQPAVIKQFQFAQLGADWADFDAYEQEINVLRHLDHPGIPRYLDSFQTPDGFCMVQEYLDAPSAAMQRSFSPQDIKQIAISVLEILAYLQSQKPPVIHRDIKPENILIDSDLNAYLVDFGFARRGGGEVATSSVVKGTLGFMPPEQLFNRQLSEASDLYGLGASLICLLTGTRSVDIGNLIDSNYNIHFQQLVPPLQRGWINWLQKMVEPRPQDRYTSAAEALKALKTLDVSRLPKVRLSRDKFEFTAYKFGEKVTQIIQVSNPIPGTVLAGRWEVEAHPSDPPHTPYDHAWISFDPQKFEKNSAECQITVDTSQLQAGKTYLRQILLHANSDPDIYPVTIKVQTAALPISEEPPSLSLGRLGFMSLFVSVSWWLASGGDRILWYTLLVGVATLAIAGFATAEKTMIAEVEGIEIRPFGTVAQAVLGAVIGAALGAVAQSWLAANDWGFLIVSGGLGMGTLLGALVADIKKSYQVVTLILGECTIVGLVLVAVAMKNIGAVYGIVVMLVTGHAIALLCWRIIVALVNARIPDQRRRGYYEKDAIAIALLTAGFCISLGAGLQLFLKIAAQLDWIEPLELAAVAGIAIAGLSATALPLLNLILFKRSRIIAEYRKSETHLIKP